MIKRLRPIFDDFRFLILNFACLSLLISYCLFLFFGKLRRGEITRQFVCVPLSLGEVKCARVFTGERLGGVRAEAKVLHQRVRQGQPGQMLFRQHVQDGRVLGCLQNEVSGLPEAVPGEDRHDVAVHVRRRGDARSRRERRESERERRVAELHQPY